MEAITDSSHLFDDDQIAERFFDHYEDIRGHIRTEILRRHLVAALSLQGGSMRVLDIGCGDARDAAWLADLGHEVVALDTSAQMLARADRYLADSGTRSVELLEGDAASALAKFGPESFDLVLSHGVLMYQPDPGEFIGRHVSLVRYDGYLSILTKNSQGLPYRAANEGRMQDALRLLDEDHSLGNLGAMTVAHSIDDIADYLAVSGATVHSWAGVRIFTDSQPIDAELSHPDDLVELEWRAASREPFRSTAALLHVIALNGINTTSIEQFR